MPEDRSAGEDLERLSALFTRGEITAEEFMSRKALLVEEVTSIPASARDKGGDAGLVPPSQGGQAPPDSGDNRALLKRTVTLLESACEGVGSVQEKKVDSTASSPGRPGGDAVAADSTPGAQPKPPAYVNGHAVSQAAHVHSQSALLRDEVDKWVERVEMATAAARMAMTPQAWRTAGQMALVVADIVSAAEWEAAASQGAEEAACRAEELAQAARAAQQAAQRAAGTARDVREAVARALKSGTVDAWHVAARAASEIDQARRSTDSPRTAAGGCDATRDASAQDVDERSTVSTGEPGAVAQLNGVVGPVGTR